MMGIDGIPYEYRMGADGTFGFYSPNGDLYQGNNDYANAVSSSLSSIIEGSAGYDLVKALIDSEANVNIQNTKHERKTIGGGNEITVRWKDGPSVGPSYKNGKYLFDAPAFVSLAHEFGHALDIVNGTAVWSEWLSLDGKHISKAEWFASFVENAIRFEHNLPIRTHYAFSVDYSSGYKMPVWKSVLRMPSSFYKGIIPDSFYKMFQPWR